MEDIVPIWGVHPVREFLRARPDSIASVLILPSFGKKPYQSRLVEGARSKGLQVLVRDAFPPGLVPPGSVHQGIAALVHPVWRIGLNDVPAPGKGETGGGGRMVIVACDQITDPRNLGAIMRSVAALTPGGCLLLPKRGSAPINGTVIKASAGP